MSFDVSIIVPIYNVANYIEKCSISLFAQTYDNIEYVFIDDCTPDNSIEVLEKSIEKFPNRKSAVKILRHEKNRGLAAARNTGILNASGQYTLHIDSDDFVDENMIERMMDSAKMNNSDIVICDIWIEWIKTRKRVYQNFVSKEQYLVDLLEARALPGMVNKLVRKTIYTDNNILSMEGINSGEDLLVSPRLVYYANVITKVDEAFYHYIQYNEGAYTKQLKIKNLQDVSFVLGSLKDFFSKVTSNSIYLKALDIGTNKRAVQYLKEIEPKKLQTVLNYFPISYNRNFSNSYTRLERIILTLNGFNSFLLKIFLIFYRMIFSLAQFIKRRN